MGLNDQLMTDAEYVATGGACCPACRGTNFTGEGVTIDLGEAFQEVYCHDCDFEWVDNYKLEGFT